MTFSFHRKIILTATIGLMTSGGTAFAQGKPIEMAVGLAAGGAGDTSARIVARHLEKLVDQPIIVVNKPGAGQIIAAAYVVKQPAESLTIGYLTNAIITSEISGMSKNAYQVKDMTPLCQVNGSGSVLVVRDNLPVKTYDELERYAKTNSMTAGHQGNGSANHLRLAALSKYRNVPMVMVPYRGEADVMTNLLGKHIDIAAVSPTTALNNLGSGKIKVLLAWGEQPTVDLGAKLPLLSEIDKTIPDVGVKTYLWARATAPKEFIQKMQKACGVLVENKEFREAFTRAGFDLIYRSGTDASAEVQQDRKRYTQLLADIDTIR